jgi:hypothetical protein
VRCGYLAADKHQFMAIIIREPRSVIRMSGPLLAVLDAKSSRNRPHLGRRAAFVCFGSRSFCAALLPRLSEQQPSDSAGMLRP